MSDPRMPTDTEMLDWLEAQNAKAKYTGRCMFRWSVSGRGWRLHESSGGPQEGETFASVRDAIHEAMFRDQIAKAEGR